MARILGEPRHALAIQDPVSGSVVRLHYRRPTSEERVAYQLSAFRFEGGEHAGACSRHAGSGLCTQPIQCLPYLRVQQTGDWFEASRLCCIQFGFMILS